MHQFLKFILE